jgi:hypothetical protein
MTGWAQVNGLRGDQSQETPPVRPLLRQALVARARPSHPLAHALQGLCASERALTEPALMQPRSFCCQSTLLACEDAVSSHRDRRGHAGVEAAWAAANLLASHPARPPTVALVTPIQTRSASCPATPPSAARQGPDSSARSTRWAGSWASPPTPPASSSRCSTPPRARGPRPSRPVRQARLRRGRASPHRLPPGDRGHRGTVERLMVEGGRVRGVWIIAALRAALTRGRASCSRPAPSCAPSCTPASRSPPAAASAKPPPSASPPPSVGSASSSAASRPARPRAQARDSDPLDDLQPSTATTPGALQRSHRRTRRIGHRNAPAEHRRRADASLDRFPPSPGRVPPDRTNAATHELIRANLHRAPMYSGQIESVGPRYCPSIEDKVVRFADRDAHTSSSSPSRSRRLDLLQRHLHEPPRRCAGHRSCAPCPAASSAEILRYGYAVEYDMVRPHQIHATGMTKLVRRPLPRRPDQRHQRLRRGRRAGARRRHQRRALARNEPEFTLGRDQAYIGVLMDDLVTKTPVEPYRMFTSRAEHRLLRSAPTTRRPC